jgi:hypothetical protein
MPDRTLYLHIGAHKTGSSAIQSFLSANSAALAARGVAYPFPGSDAGATITTGNAARLNKYLLGNGQDFEGYLAGIREAARHCHSVVLSNEQLFFTSRGREAEIAGLFADYSLRIIVYLRRQDDWIESLCNQTIKYNGSTTYDHRRFLRFIDYARPVRDWGAVVGAGNVIVRRYGSDAARGASFLRDFVAVFADPVQPGLDYPVRVVNPRLGAEGLELMCALNACRYPAAVHRRLRDALLAEFSLSRHPGPPARILSASERRAILDAAHASNEDLARLTGSESPLFFDNLDVEDFAWTPPKHIPPGSVRPLFDMLDRALRRGAPRRPGPAAGRRRRGAPSSDP